MRFSTVAAALCLGLLPIAGGIAVVPRGQSMDVPASPGAVAPPATAPAAPAPLSGDAAAKHAKRTACLKSAKEKKLVGADKTAFLKTCIAAP